LARRFGGQSWCGNYISDTNLTVVSELKLDKKDLSQQSKSESDPVTQDDILRTLLPNSRLEQYISRIQVIISTLQRLNIAIRNPVPVDRYRKAKLIDVEIFRSWADSHFRELFGEHGIPEFLRERAVAAMLDRRRFFEYCSRHHMKLAEGASTEVDIENDMEKSQLSDTEASSILQNVDITSLKTHDDEVDDVSQTSYATFTAFEGHRIPGPPKDAELGGDPFECPYCFLMINPRNWMAWK
jgi:hypothetical protein